jgi:hypothetical protein
VEGLHSTEVSEARKLHSDLPIRIYICCNQMVNTEIALRNILFNLQESELKSEKVIIVHSSDWQPYESLNEFQLDIEYRNSQMSFTDYEHPTLRMIWEDSWESDFYGLYLHCKGASKSDVDILKNSLAWANLMLYGLVENSQLCIQHLNAGCQIVGSMYYRHFKGNFFWFNSIYAKELLDPYLMPHYHTRPTTLAFLSAEYWITYPLFNNLMIPRVKNLFYLNPPVSDHEFINVRERPSLSEKYEAPNSIEEIIESGSFEIYDQISMTDDEFQRHRDVIKKYLNYDGSILIRDSETQIDYRDI